MTSFKKILHNKKIMVFNIVLDRRSIIWLKFTIESDLFLDEKQMQS